MTGGWKEHPLSPVIVGDAGEARPGGRSFVFDHGRIIRIAQKDDVTYGAQVRAFEVDVLTESQYSEHEVFQSPLLFDSGSGWNKDGMHQFDPWWDGTHWICSTDGLNNGVWSIGIFVTEDESPTRQDDGNGGGGGGGGGCFITVASEPDASRTRWSWAVLFSAIWLGFGTVRNGRRV